MHSILRRALMASLTVFVSACGESDIVGSRDESLDIECSIPVSEVQRGATRGAIPALTEPALTTFGEVDATYFDGDDRVVGVIVDGEPVAIPLAIFWWHEIVNFDNGGDPIAVTHCPLTGSTLAFRRDVVEGAAFEVSGLLYQNNLMMADLSEGAESLWPQMARGARCGPRDGDALPMYPVVETTWDGWSALHPESAVVSSFTGYGRSYLLYPYDDYADTDNDFTLFPVRRMDDRRPPKERVLGIPDGDGGDVYPFGILHDSGLTEAIHGSTSDGAYVVLWDRESRTATAFRPVAAGQELTFFGASRTFFDEETGSEWRIDGVAVDGPLAGTSLEPVPEAFVAFWFAWPLFYPDVEIWEL